MEFKGVERNADGTINLGDFLKIKDGAVPEGVGPTGESTPSPELSLVPDIECVYSESWIWDNKLDPYHHWHECECGNKKDVGDHTFEYVIDKEPTETQPGYKHNECTVCGYKKVTIEIPPLGNGNDDVPTEEPTGFAAIWQAIVEFFESIVAWFKDLFGGAKK